jgi:predicted amidohydrolase YtcJ
VTDMNIAMSLHACIHHHNPDERLTPQEAIRVYTKNNTWLNKEEHIFGEIAPGFVSDLSVMDTDFTKPFDYKKSATMFIVSRGKVVYASS